MPTKHGNRCNVILEHNPDYGRCTIWLGIQQDVWRSKRLQILLNKTREEYARKDDVKEDMHDIMDAIKRLEDKLDKDINWS